MKKEDLRIVYMGTPDFAVESLRALVEGGYNVVGVITMPDKPMGRHGSVLQPSAVKQYAVSVGLAAREIEGRGIFRGTACLAGGFADRGGVSYVAGGGLEYAPSGNF